MTYHHISHAAIVQSPKRWTMIEIKKKIENLELRMMKAKWFNIDNRSFCQLNERSTTNDSKSGNAAPKNRNKQSYIKLAK